MRGSGPLSLLQSPGPFPLFLPVPALAGQGCVPPPEALWVSLSCANVWLPLGAWSGQAIVGLWI